MNSSISLRSLCNFMCSFFLTVSQKSRAMIFSCISSGNRNRRLHSLRFPCCPRANSYSSRQSCILSRFCRTRSGFLTFISKKKNYLFPQFHRKLSKQCCTMWATVEIEMLCWEACNAALWVILRALRCPVSNSLDPGVSFQTFSWGPKLF